MSTTDFLNSLGAGASFSTKEVVTSLVAAERAPMESRIQRRIDKSETEISGLASALSSLNLLKASADKLKDSSDYDRFSVTNSQSTAFTIAAGPGADVGNHSVTVSAIAKSQTTNLMGAGSTEFTSKTQLLNGGTAFDINIQVGGGSGVTYPITVATDTPQGLSDAINAADIGISANLIDTGTNGTDFIIQLTGSQGASNAFTVTESSTSVLSNSIPSGFSAADATISVNGISFTRSNNNINDIIPGVTFSLNSTTSGAASIALSRDTTGVVQDIKSFVETYNISKADLDKLTSSELDGELRGDSIIRGTLREIRSLLTSISSTPGNSITSLSEIGIAINKIGAFEINEAKLDSNIVAHFDDIKKILSADTTDQSSVGEASRGIAGDLSKLIDDLQGSAGYINTRTATLNSKLEEDRQELVELDDKMSRLQERYEKQFLTMQRIIDEMDNTRDNLISSFENLPFTNRD